ncbi:1-(5-phosphoribosyl)-5-[(5-phosphoribosylamino)methylideneamino]imidazole-4-carboxamide isomerase [Petrocella sp. FN5]|uniref:1-(5-phosphoribosyl)-5-[(5- phosphoribosylamino)methylideneamino]imidazole-4- carboxamide isomerase n=1 Tax=Petrocella sp. FN5 TaxID=3032002 RepID=UPI0023DA38F4|nr:1-(5-phosphoribosyl)-5-[(5-phosphoribosylamino)methylideneamino]imidazole-4-carboxamide isomerase [Petrocella sp. FN5]MDF1616343.1 1-(5-phosphoribosyl)-5-[(5-phosphoribosylamino)methylideneamino]imidazole-4-carboxamide isomerase [Petrocella sp. FN5]
MRLYPAIDIINGQAVRLVQGDYKKETVYDKDPVQVAKQWEDAGADYIHVVDLDGAQDGTWKNRETISNIVKSVKVPVQTGGGIRSLQDIEERLSVGIARVILGTVAIKNPALVSEAVNKFGQEAIVVGIDAKDGMVAIHGWEQVSDMSALDLCLKVKAMGITTIIYTDIAKDGMMLGPNIEQTRQLIQETGMNIIASGGVSNYEDLEKVSQIQAEGVIIGKALYTKAIDLKKAIRQFESR